MKLIKPSLFKEKTGEPKPKALGVDLSPLNFPYTTLIAPGKQASKPIPRQPAAPVSVVRKHEPNTLVWRPFKEGGGQYEYVENPQGPKWYFKKSKKRYYVMVKNMSKGEKSADPEFVAFNPAEKVDPDLGTAPGTLVESVPVVVPPAQDKAPAPELVAFNPPQDLENLPSRLRRALYNWESWGRTFGYQLSKSEKLTQALMLIAFIIFASVFIIVLYQG